MIVRQANEKCKIPLGRRAEQDRRRVRRARARARPIGRRPPWIGRRGPSSFALALEQLGEKRSVQAVDLKFANVRYFACSSLGRTPDPGNTSPFEATGVVEPLLWLLGLEGPPGLQ